MNNHKPEILFVQTGGTIDKAYPKPVGGFAFEIHEPAILRVLDRVKNLSLTLRCTTTCRKDSQEITEEDRQLLVQLITEQGEFQKVLVTHGTDTMIETAMYLQSKFAGAEKVIVLTGAVLPETFKESDADFNVGMAIATAQLASAGVWIVMNGSIIAADKRGRDENTGQFFQKD